MSIQFTGCDLHFPHKEWSGDERERQNYLAIERWANYFLRNCGPKGGAAPAPETPPDPGPFTIVAHVDPDSWQNSSPFGPIQYPQARTKIRWNSTDPDTSFAGGARYFINTGETTRNPGNIQLPVGTYLPFSMSVTCAERSYSGDFPPPIAASDPGGTDSVTRTLELQLRNSTVAWGGDPADPTGLIWSRVQSATGPRFSITVSVDAPGGTYSVVTHLRAYITFNNIRDNYLAAPAQFAGGLFMAATGPRIAGHS